MRKATDRILAALLAFVLTFSGISFLAKASNPDSEPALGVESCDVAELAAAHDGIYALSRALRGCPVFMSKREFHNQGRNILFFPFHLAF